MSLKTDFIESLGPYYHVTTPDSWEQIQDTGLKPMDFEFGYSDLAPRKDPLICLTADHRKDKWVEVFCDRYESVVRLEIPSVVIIERDFGLDYTSEETKLYLYILDSHDNVLEKNGDIACYYQIPAPEIYNFEEIDCSQV